MRPAFLDNMSWAMAEVYGAVTDRILINLAKYFPYIKQGGEALEDFEYQARMLAKMGQVNSETAKIIADSLDGADAALRGVLEAAITDALKTEEPKLRRAAEAGLLNGPGFAPPEVAPGMMQAFQSYYRQSADKLNLVNTAMLESTQNVYAATVADAAQRIRATQSILNAGAGEVVTGVSSWNQAMHDAVQKMVANGLTGFVDNGGHHWAPEAYVAMDIRTTMANTAREAVWEDNERYGNDLYQVSAHPGSRPGCYPYQLWVVSTSGRQGTTTDFDGNTVIIHNKDEIKDFQYGGGLFGVNCGHYPIGFVPGISPIRGEIQPKEENDALYAEMQGQRNLERQLRYEKRDLEVMKSQGAKPEAIKAQKERVDAARTKLKDYCEEHNLPRYRNREYTPVNATWPDTGGTPPKGGDNPPDTNPPQPPMGFRLGPDNIPPQARGRSQG